MLNSGSALEPITVTGVGISILGESIVDAKGVAFKFTTSSLASAKA